MRLTVVWCCCSITWRLPPNGPTGNTKAEDKAPLQKRASTPKLRRLMVAVFVWVGVVQEGGGEWRGAGGRILWLSDERSDWTLMTKTSWITKRTNTYTCRWSLSCLM